MSFVLNTMDTSPVSLRGVVLSHMGTIPLRIQVSWP